jgi:hypothetical protein
MIPGLLEDDPEPRPLRRVWMCSDRMCGALDCPTCYPGWEDGEDGEDDSENEEVANETDSPS